MSVTGFKSYAVYLFIKNIHFANNSFNIMNHQNEIPMKDKLINSWNKKRVKRDGIKFLEIEKQFNTVEELTLLYSSYYIDNNNFYVNDIIEDEFNIYNKNKAELNNLEEHLTNDFKYVIIKCKENKISSSKLFIGKTSLPPIFKMNLSYNSLVILDDLFNIIKLNEKLKINNLEKMRWENVKLNMKGYKLIIQKFLDKKDWRKIVKNIIK